MRPLSAEIKHNYILHTFPKKNSCIRILTINSVIASYHNRDYQDQQNAFQRPEELIFQGQETLSPTAPGRVKCRASSCTQYLIMKEGVRITECKDFSS